jgi:hypothetical protein
MGLENKKYKGKNKKPIEQNCMTSLTIRILFLKRTKNSAQKVDRTIVSIEFDVLNTLPKT